MNKKYQKSEGDSDESPVDDLDFIQQRSNNEKGPTTQKPS